MEQELISVIVPIYNTEKYLIKCINSIINQTYKNIEIILIDDGSTDSSKKICDDFSKIDSRIIVIHKKNEGVSKARNIGLKISNGKYIAFIDSDDCVEKKYLETLYKKMIEPEIDMSMISVINNNDKIMINEKFILNCFTTKENGEYYGYIWGKLLKNNIIKENNIKFNENITYNEDRLFIVEYALRCNKVKIIKNGTYYKYNYNKENSNSAMKQKKFDTKMLSEFKAYDIMYNTIEKSNMKSKVDILDVIAIQYFYSAIRGYKQFKNSLFLNCKKKYIKNILKSKKIQLKQKVKVLLLDIKYK